MKILNLSSKKSMVLASLGVGLLVTLVLYIFTVFSKPALETDLNNVTRCLGQARCLNINYADYGWPFKFNITGAIVSGFNFPYSFLFDVIFWSIITAIIFKIKKSFQSKAE